MTQDQLQEDVVDAMDKFYADNTKGYLNLAMRSGKTKITIDFLKKAGYEKDQILIAYPDNKLEESWINECIKWGFIGENIRYVNFRSLEKCLDQDWDVFICDEFHKLSPFQLEIAQEIDSTISIFLSGTITQETKERWPEFKEIYKYTTDEGIKNGVLADYQITVHLVSLDDKVKTPNKKGKLLTEKQKYDNYSYVISQMIRDGRNAMHLALSRNRLSLSSIGKMTYLRKLLNGEMRNKRGIVFTGLAEVADSIGIPSYHSKSLEHENFNDFINGYFNWLALAQMGKVGVTYPDLDSVILLNFTYNKEESSQILNRALMLDYKGKIADLHVLCLNEPPEIKKVKESLSMLNQSKIKYV